MNSDDDFPIRQALPVGARFWCWACWARISIEIIVYYSRYNTFILVTHISMAQRGGHGWMTLDDFGSPCLILGRQLLCISQLRGPQTMI